MFKTFSQNSLKLVWTTAVSVVDESSCTISSNNVFHLCFSFLTTNPSNNGVYYKRFVSLLCFNSLYNSLTLWRFYLWSWNSSRQQTGCKFVHNLTGPIDFAITFQITQHNLKIYYILHCNLLLYNIALLHFFFLEFIVTNLASRLIMTQLLLMQQTLMIH